MRFDVWIISVDNLWLQMAVKNCFIRGSVVRYVQLPPEHVDTQLLEDATRRGTLSSSLICESSHLFVLVVLFLHWTDVPPSQRLPIPQNGYKESALFIFRFTVIARTRASEKKVTCVHERGSYMNFEWVPPIADRQAVDVRTLDIVSLYDGKVV